jgi:hypothetical protein
MQKINFCNTILFKEKVPNEKPLFSNGHWSTVYSKLAPYCFEKRGKHHSCNFVFEKLKFMA